MNTAREVRCRIGMSTQQGTMPLRAGAVSRQGCPSSPWPVIAPAARRMTASAFSLSVLYPSFTTGGAGRTRDRRPSWRDAPFLLPALHELALHRPEGLDEFVNVRTAMLEDPSRFPPYVETWTKRERCPGRRRLQSTASEKAAAPMERYPELAAERFAQEVFKTGKSPKAIDIATDPELSCRSQKPWDRDGL